MENITEFSIQLCTSKGLQTIVKLCSSGKTDWFLRPAYDIDMCYFTHVDIFRSTDKENVKVDVILSYYKHGKILWQETFTAYIADGENFSRKSPEFITKPCLGDELRGSIIIHGSYSLTNSPSQAVERDCCSSAVLLNDFLRLLNNPDSYPDATIKCGSTSIPVHKCILSTRSPVFAAMFQNEMQESSNGIVDIIDIDPVVLQAMLRYVYSSKSDHMTDTISADMLFVADKYQLEELKLICIKKLKTNMAASNVFKCLVLGDLHDEGLKRHAMDFIRKWKKFSELEKTKEWETLLKERPGLAVEVMTSLVKYLQENCDKTDYHTTAM